MANAGHAAHEIAVSLSDSAVLLDFQSALEVSLVIVKALRGIRAGNLDIRDYGQHYHEMADFDLDIDIGQHRDIGGRNQVKQEFSLVGQQAVLRKGLNFYSSP